MSTIGRFYFIKVWKFLQKCQPEVGGGQKRLKSCQRSFWTTPNANKKNGVDRQKSLEQNLTSIIKIDCLKD